MDPPLQTNDGPQTTLPCVKTPDLLGDLVLSTTWNDQTL